MARRLKAVTPVWEDVPDDEGDDGAVQWVALTVTSDMKLDLKPYIRTAEVMVNPNKAGDYHVKLPTAKKIVTLLGEGWIIEGGAIVQSLPFKMEWPYRHPIKDYQTTEFDACRKLLAGVPKETLAKVRGICVFNSGERPDVTKPGWLYIGIPNGSSVPNTRSTFFGVSIKPELVAGEAPARVSSNGLPNSEGTYDYAFYAPQAVYARIYSAQPGMVAQIVNACVRDGAVLAMDCPKGDISLNKWLSAAALQMKSRRSMDIEDAEKKLKASEDKIRILVEEVRGLRGKADDERYRIAGLKEPVSAKNVLKQYPSLINVEKINRDDPTFTLITTKDIVINGVNLGPYTISIRPDLAALVITGSKKPADLIHPNLYQHGKEWVWHIDPKHQEKVLECIASDKLGEATALIVDNLLTLFEDKKEYHDRLERIKNYIPTEKRKPGRPKKAKEVEPAPVAVAEGIEGDPIKA